MASLRTALVLASVSAVALGAAGPADASSFSLRSGQSAQGLGLSFAGAASGGIGLGAMAWNPAAITLFEGRNSQLNVSYILPQADYVSTDPATLGLARATGLSPNTGNLGLGGAVVPASYTNFRVGDLYLGWTTGAPWGLSSKPENQNYVGQIYGRSSTIRTINVAPTIGWKVNDWLSLGAAVQFQYFSTTLKQADVTQPFTRNAPNSILEGDDIGFGFRIGAVLTPWQGATIGVGYRSAVDHNLDGTLTLPSAVPGGLPAGRYGISGTLTLPDSVTVGYSQVLNDRWTVHLGGEWTNWSLFDDVPISLATTGTRITTLPFQYDDSWYVAAGAEYAWNDRLTLRGGIAYEWSAVSDRVRTTRISDNDRLWVSVGAGYRISEKLRLDASYAHLFVQDATVAINPTSGNPTFVPFPAGAPQAVYNAEAEPSVDIFSVSLTYRWDDPARPAPAQGVFKP